MTKVESVMKPDGILDDFRWKPVVFICFCFFHGKNCRRISINLSVPHSVTCVWAINFYARALEIWRSDTIGS